MLEAVLTLDKKVATALEVLSVFPQTLKQLSWRFSLLLALVVAPALLFSSFQNDNENSY